MKVIRDLTAMRCEEKPVALAVGFFDGVHTGHRRVIRIAVNRARRLGGCAWVMTFDPHPMDVLKPGAAPPMLTSVKHKLQLLDSLGVHGCLVLSFTRKLAALEPAAFARLLRRAVPTLREIIVGENWRFGRRGEGDAELLAELGGKLGFRARIVRPAMRGGRAVSSTRIRSEVMNGNLKEAAAMLGRPISVLGTVVHGRGVGRKLGFPTANLNCHSEVLPPCGIYVARALVDGMMCNGIINLGTSPTFTRRNIKPVLELHLFDLRRNLYGRDIEVVFVTKLRDERRFASAEALSAQIGKDVALARRLLKRGK